MPERLLIPSGKTSIYQETRKNQMFNFLFEGKDGDNNIHSVFTSIPQGMQIGRVISLWDGRTFMFCKNVGAAAVTVGRLVSAGFTSYSIDATNEVIIATTDRRFVEWYLGGSGTAISDLTTIVGGYIHVISSTGAGIIRRILSAEAFTQNVSGTDRVAYRVRLDIPLTTDLAATSVLAINFLIPNVTLYDSGADNNSLVVLGISASDNSVAQDSFMFVQMSGVGAVEIDGAAAVAGKEVMASDTGANGDGRVELRDDLAVPSFGTAIEAIADGVTGIVLLHGQFGSQM